MNRFSRFRIRRPKGEKRRLLAGIHPIPTMVTLGNLICGFASIMLAMRANNLPIQVAGSTATPMKPEDYLYIAGILIFVAMIFDVLDGSVARLTKSTSKFGMEMDSLCDVVSFGVAPAVLVKSLLDHQAAALAKPFPMLDRYIFPLLVIYVSCAALRLARYNVESDSGHRSFFFGMPSPGAAGCAASLVIMSLPGSHHWQMSPLNDQVTQLEQYLDKLRGPIMLALPFIMLALGILMVSRVHYQHIGDKILRGRKSLMHLLVLVIALALVIMHHEIMLAAAFNGYMLFGIVNEVRFQLFPKHRPADWNVPAPEAALQPPIDTAKPEAPRDDDVRP